MGAWLTEWLNSVKRSARPKTHRTYEQLVRLHLVPALGTILLDRLTARDIRQAEDSLAAKGLSTSTVRSCHTVLGTALQAAVTEGLISANPQRAVQGPRVTHRAKVILSHDSAQKLLEAAFGTPLDALFVIALTMGLREGELFALRWKNIDLKKGTIDVHGTLGTDSDGEAVIGETKTAAGRRTVNLTDPARAALTRMVPGAPDDLVFTHEGAPLTPKVLARGYFRPLLREAKLPTMPFHDLRHTAATHLLEDGVPIHAVSHLLGHANVGVTLGIYGHLTAKMTEQATVAMNRRYGAL